MHSLTSTEFLQVMDRHTFSLYDVQAKQVVRVTLRAPFVGSVKTAIMRHFKGREMPWDTKGQFNAANAKQLLKSAPYFNCCQIPKSSKHITLREQYSQMEICAFSSNHLGPHL